MSGNVIEGIEYGSSLFLFDEDSCATNFMGKSEKLKALGLKESITSYSVRCQSIYTELGISSILVVGGDGEYLDIADRVYAMENFMLRDLTEEAKVVVERFQTGTREKCLPPAGGWSNVLSGAQRNVNGSSLNFKIVNRGRETINFMDKFGAREPVKNENENGKGDNEDGGERQEEDTILDLRGLEQLTHTSQTSSICEWLMHLSTKSNNTNNLSVKQIVQLVNSSCGMVAKEGTENVEWDGSIASVRGIEVAMSINRIRFNNLIYLGDAK